MLQASLEWNSLSLLTVGKPVHFKQILTSPLKRACFLQIMPSSALAVVSPPLTVYLPTSLRYITRDVCFF